MDQNFSPFYRENSKNETPILKILIFSIYIASVIAFMDLSRNYFPLKFAKSEKKSTINSGFISFEKERMSLSRATKAWKLRYYLLLTLFIAAVGVLGFFYGSSYLKQRAILGVEQDIQSQQETLDQLYQNS